MPVSEENEAVLKGRIAPKKNGDSEEDDKVMDLDKIKMGLNGDVER